MASFNELLPTGRIVFSFPYYEVSGVPVLFSRLALYLREQYRVDVAVIDYPTGYMAKTLVGTGVEIIPFLADQPLNLNASDCLVLQSVHPYSMHKEIIPHANTKIVFWNLHPYNWVQLLPLPLIKAKQLKDTMFSASIMRYCFPAQRKQLATTAQDMNKKSSLFFMDGENKQVTQTVLGLSFGETDYLPVPCDAINENRKLSSMDHSVVSTGEDESSGGVRFAWVGRVCDFKVYILKRAIFDAERHCVNNKVDATFHVVGEGDELHQLNSVEGSLTRVKLIFHGNITGSGNLNDFLLRDVDIMFAMGTAALESSKLGIPTVLLDPSYSEVPKGYQYRWLHNTEDFTLGEMVNDSSIRPDIDSLSVLVSELAVDYKRLSTAAYTYCQDNHFMPVVANKFLAKISKSSYQYKDFSIDVLTRPTVFRLYLWLREHLLNLSVKLQKRSV